MVLAPDKFRGSATAAEVAEAMARAGAAAGWTADRRPVSDGGRRVLRRARRPGPRRPAGPRPPRRPGRRRVVRARRRHDGGRRDGHGVRTGRWRAGRTRNDPVRADTAGTGELIAAAVKAGARHVLVGHGRIGHDRRRVGGPGGAGAAQPPRRGRAGRRLRRHDPLSSTRRPSFLRKRGRQPRRCSSSPAGSSAWPRSTWNASASTSHGLEGLGRRRRSGGRAGRPRRHAGARLRPGGRAHRPGRADRRSRPGGHRRGACSTPSRSTARRSVGVVALAREVGCSGGRDRRRRRRANTRSTTGPWSTRSGRSGPGPTPSAPRPRSSAGCSKPAERARPSCGAQGTSASGGRSTKVTATGLDARAQQARRSRGIRRRRAGSPRPAQGEPAGWRAPGRRARPGAGCGGPARRGRTGPRRVVPNRAVTSISSPRSTP